jgi:hypothetical protein
MGIFGKAAEARVNQILTRFLGVEQKVELYSGAKARSIDLNIDKRVYVGATKDYFACIEHAEIVGFWPWKSVFSIENGSLFPGMELMIWSERDGYSGIHTKEYPYRYIHPMNLDLYSKEAMDTFQNLFLAAKIEAGYTTESIEIFREWAKLAVLEPVTLQRFNEVNKAWQTKEFRDNYYVDVWGQTLDAERLVYFTGREICSGKLPKFLLNIAIEEFDNMAQQEATHTLKKKEFSEEFDSLVERTLACPQSSKILGSRATKESQWFLAKAESKYGDWQGNMNMKERRAFVEVIPSQPKEGIPALRIWNDFNEGNTSLVVDDIDKTGVLRFAENRITFRKDDIPRLKKALVP